MVVKQREIKFLIWFQDLNEVNWLSWVTISSHIIPLRKTLHFLSSMSYLCKIVMYMKAFPKMCWAYTSLCSLNLCHFSSSNEITKWAAQVFLDLCPLYLIPFSWNSLLPNSTCRKLSEPGCNLPFTETLMRSPLSMYSKMFLVTFFLKVLHHVLS